MVTGSERLADSDTIANTEISRKCVISGFHREVPENCPLLGYYAESSGNLLPTFRDKLSVPSSAFKIPILEP